MIDPEVGDELLVERKLYKSEPELLDAKVTKVGRKYFYVRFSGMPGWLDAVRFERGCKENAIDSNTGDSYGVRVWSSLEARAQSLALGAARESGTAGVRALDLIFAHGKTPHALKLNRDGSPAHPLYLSSKLHPVPMAVSI